VLGEDECEVVVEWHWQGTAQSPFVRGRCY